MQLARCCSAPPHITSATPGVWRQSRIISGLPHRQGTQRIKRWRESSDALSQARRTSGPQSGGGDGSVSHVSFNGVLRARLRAANWVDHADATGRTCWAGEAGAAQRAVVEGRGGDGSVEERATMRHLLLSFRNGRAGHTPWLRISLSAGTAVTHHLGATFLYCSESSSNFGAIILHGPHHDVE